MFESCTSLAPKGPTESSHHNFIYISEDNLHTYCFKKMFADCPSIVNIYIDLDN
ncbi:MAG: hypothetical protein MJ200_04170 [Mycoplasmoidaceae bacterium]|nr:hypothetical protein [Mycoplasmoidaceae bacterium]